MPRCSLKVRRLLALMFAGVLLLGACGDDDGGSASGSDNESTDEGSGNDSGGDTGVGGGDCAATSISGTTPSGASFSGSTAVAASLVDGAAYTMYVADFPLTTDDFGIVSNPEVPADGIMWTIAVTIFNAAPEDIVPIEVGEVVEAGRPFGELTFTVTVDEGDEFSGNSLGQEGTVTVTAVGDTLCGTIDYTDDEKSVSGTFEAVTKAL